MRAEETAVGANLDRQARPLREGGQMLGQPPLAAFGHGHGVETAGVQRAGQFAGYGAGVVGIVDGDVSHRQPLGSQALGVVSHGGEDQGDLLLVVADIGRLVAHLGHQKGVGGRVQPVQRAQIVRQLVAQHQPQNRQARLRRFVVASGPNAKTGLTDWPDPFLFASRHGAGEAIRTPDPNLGNVGDQHFRAFQDVPKISFSYCFT